MANSILVMEGSWSDHAGENNGRSGGKVQFEVPAMHIVQPGVAALRRQHSWMFQAGKTNTHKSNLLGIF